MPEIDNETELFDDHPGARIREQRRLARLTQRELANRIPFSYSLLNQVECGARVATSAFITAVAQALHIDPAVLSGQSNMTDMQQARLVPLVRPIRAALDLYDLDPDDIAPRPLDVLIDEADRLCQQVRATHLRAAARDVPSLIAELTCLTGSQPTTRAWQALASSYRTAQDIALKLGFPDLATVALDRMAWAAERASDPCLAAIRQYKRALVHKDMTPDLGRRLIQTGHDLLAGESSREAKVVKGQLHLGASAIAARAEDGPAVEAHINAARRLATDLDGGTAAVHWLSFGKVNVALHNMGASVTMRRYGQALEQARKLKLPASTLTSRRARFLVDRAVVEMETGHADAALRHLVEARRAAPEQTRYHPGTHAAIRGLVHTARRTPESLSNMAAWVGM
ncbi:MAG: helix-turn-helix transcriptional regulator [Nocardiopsaceae bacterium]|nr:helix-turn-helix transcriptional regulator [Nocardiopsaceae bacterium]